MTASPAIQNDPITPATSRVTRSVSFPHSPDTEISRLLTPAQQTWASHGSNTHQSLATGGRAGRTPRIRGGSLRNRNGRHSNIGNPTAQVPLDTAVPSYSPSSSNPTSPNEPVPILEVRQLAVVRYYMRIHEAIEDHWFFDYMRRSTWIPCILTTLFVFLHLFLVFAAFVKTTWWCALMNDLGMCGWCPWDDICIYINGVCVMDYRVTQPLRRVAETL